MIDIKSNGSRCFLWCPIQHLNPLKTHLERKAEADENMVNDPNYEGIELSVSKEDYCRIEQKNNTCINVFYYENDFTYPAHISNGKRKDCIDLLLIADENMPHYVYVKDFNRFMCNKTKSKNEKHFYKHCLRCFSSERFLIEHKGTCLKIND